ncbi:MAG: cytochrome d ubiquinol oxidase subunit II [Chlamydiales bacterium]|jgi:cytochrome d ubiquinol oxidase subunit II
MLEVVVCFLGASLILYCIFGGADFGAGILEIFKGKTRRKEQVSLITQAMGPVWESNHMWLIIAVVVFFNGFPKAFAQFSIFFHIPLTIMLMGIIMRGCAFTFRHYDAFQDDSQKVYSFIFAVSSAFTPFMMGSIAGACLLGNFHEPGSASYYATFVTPWLNIFSSLIGLYLCGLFSFVASTFLLLEAEDEEMKALFKRRVKLTGIFSLSLGGLIFIYSGWAAPELFTRFLSNNLSLSCITLATGLLYPLWKSLDTRNKRLSQFLVSALVSCVLLGYFTLMYPEIIHISAESAIKPINFYNTAAGPETLYYLIYSLSFGLIFIVPALCYLFYIFKLQK